MMHVRRPLLVAPLALAASIVILLLLSFTDTNPSRAQNAGGAPPDASAPCDVCGGSEETPHTLAASYYTVRDGLTATLMLNNKGPRRLEVTPTLFSLAGERLELPAVAVEGMSFREIDMRDFQVAGTAFERGSLQLFHRGKDLVIGAQIKLVDEARSLIFEEKLLEISTEIGAQRLEGLWYLPTHRSTLRLILSNTTDAEVPVTVSVEGVVPRQGEPLRLTLSPHETRLLDPASAATGRRGASLRQVGGIRVEHTSPAGSLLARTLVEDPAAGYSSSLRFYDPKKAKSTNLQGAGLRVGGVGAERVTPVVVARNTSADPTTITGRIPYTRGDGETGVVSLPAQRLEAGETKVIETGKALKESGAEDDIAAAGLEFEYTGAPGGVIMTAQSLGRNGDHAFQVPMWDIAAQRSSTGGYPWSIEGETSTFVYIKNVTDRPQEYTLQINFAGGVYATGLKKVAPGQTVALDVRALRDGQIPDAQGQVLPPDAARGQIQWSSYGPETQALIGRMEQVNLPGRISASYACQNCCPDGWYTGWLTPGSAFIFINAFQSFAATEQRKNCYGTLMTPFSVSPHTWRSTDTSVATMAYGSMTAVDAGETTAVANWTSYVYYNGYGGACYSQTINPGGGAPVTVPPTVTNVTAGGATNVASVGSASIMHFVTPKGGSGSTVTLTATISPDTTAARGRIDWEGATESGSNPLEATVSKSAAGKNVVKIKYTNNAGSVTTLKELRVWVVWASVSGSVGTTPTVTPLTDGSGRRDGTQVSASYSSTVSIDPATIISDADRPALSGANTVAPPGGNNAAGLPLSGGADKKWDVSRRIARVMTVTAANPALTLSALDVNINFPSDPVVGNDDAGPGDENNDPYSGAMTSVDAPSRSFRLQGGNVGQTYRNQTSFQEFVRLELGGAWVVISDADPWSVDFRFIKRAVTETLWGGDFNGDGDTNDDITEAMLGVDTNGDGDTGDVVGYWDDNSSVAAN
jgi:hypothetical protein